MRLIDAEPIEKFIEDGLNNPDMLKAFGHDAIEVLTEIHFAPTIDPASLRPKGEWISVEDRLPQEGGAVCENVILFMDNGLVTVGWLNQITNRGYYLDTINDVVIKAPLSRFTHWMPLPEPPNCGADMRPAGASPRPTDGGNL